jgi:hypothetical protein
LKRVDAVDVVTPPQTHLHVIKRCIPYVPIFVEKPIVETEREGKALLKLQDTYPNILMVGHIYRYNPILKKLKELIEKSPKTAMKITGHLTKAIADDTHVDPSLDFVHHVDTLDYIFGLEPEVISKRVQGRVHELSLRYPGDIDAILELGWIGNQRKNQLSFSFATTVIQCDFLTNTITIIKDGKTESIHVRKKVEPLKKELLLFLDVLKSPRTTKYPSVDVGLKVVRASGWKHAPQRERQLRKRVAIIGAGIFGATTAFKLGESFEVTVFERNNDVMTEASYVNQYRHHWGYHYPRSNDTVADIRKAMGAFEQEYESAIIRGFPTYYSLAKHGSKVNAKEYEEFCKKHALPYEVITPGDAYVNQDKVSLNVKTLEPIYNYSLLREIVQKRLRDAVRVTLKFNSAVIGGYLNPDGTKVLMYQENGVMRSAEFDYVINCTYANYNLFPSWFRFARKRIRVDLVETLIMHIPIPRISFAIMDGPFTNVVPTEHENIFTLVHIRESVLHRFVPADGLIPPGLTYTSNAKKIIDESIKWLPFLKDAKYIESRYVFRSVNADREYDDARPSDVTYHGFGCWSVLGGKIVNCVATAKHLAQELRKDTS